MADDLIEVRGLKVSFGSDAGLARVLDGVDLTIRRGEIMGLVGESGCGKTTLARSILGILPANATRIEAGAIRFEGRELLGLDPATLAREVRGKAIAYIPQDPFTAFNPVFTIGTQIDDLMRFKSPLLREGRMSGRERRRQDRARVLDLLRLVQLPDPEGVLRQYPHEVSPARHRRRTDHGARRHRAGADPDAAEAPGARTRGRGAVHHP
jgi:peptide/nickel transport system ATP-binding protein